MSPRRSRWLRLPSLVLIALAVLLAGVTRVRSDAPVAAWVVLVGQSAGLQLFADTRQPLVILAALNAGTGAAGVVQPSPAGPAVFQDRSGAALPVTAYSALPLWQQRASDLLMALSAGNLADARVLLRQARAAALHPPFPGIAAPEAVDHGLTAISDELESLPHSGANAAVRLAALASHVSALLLTPHDDDLPHLDGVIVSARSINFGEVCVGDTATRTFTLTTDVPDFQITVAGSTVNAPFTVTGLPAVVKTGQVATVTVTFKPTNDAEQTATLELQTSSVGKYSMGLGGIGRGTFAVSPPTVEFGEVPVGTSKEMTFQIKNCSQNELTVKFGKPKGKNFALEIPTPLTIPGQGTETYTVQFSPDKPYKEYYDKLPLKVSRTGVKKSKESDEVYLHGTCPGPPSIIGVSAKTVDFGVVPVNESKTQKLTITNNSQQPQKIRVDPVLLDSRFFHLSQTGEITLAAGQSLDLEVQFGATGKCSHKDNLLIDFGEGFAQRIRVLVKAISQ